MSPGMVHMLISDAIHTEVQFHPSVMEQVKKDMEADEKLKKDWDTVQRSTEKMREHSKRQEEHLRNWGENVQSFSSNASEKFSVWKNRTVENASVARHKISETLEQHEYLRAARDVMRTGVQSGGTASQAVFSRTRSILTGGIDRMSSAFNSLSEEKAQGLKQWKAARDSAAAAQAAAAAAAEKAAADAEAAEGSGTAGASAGRAAEPADALVVSKTRSSSWDRFGAGLRDMPFLSSVFENPLFDQLFGESEIAASIREMKEIDCRFRLEDFAEDIEYVVAPHIISNYLQGDQDALQKHCGDAAFAAVNASIKARIQQKLTLDTAILAGPKEFELKGAKLMEKSAPCFIWTFNTQQVNCLRDSEGEIIEGAVDDIRTVHYAMAVTRHPELEKLDLEYPWQVSELAILGNQPCW
eukprot:CAMPEP_0179060078 /NCGR_PEP_ID=MMETSP0796-20121207/25680_1 /TAXON_ID=73915 /ORGANISM="Pyrodinium bahamense, Strain pbaha01" /LENGTH=412 /DNA_ID=CAMNT_0020756849 /DNA_START=174 /DNA_END=1413 /DNA_ORIENTATION=+